jgi:putative ABC transport system substrate-binding protein
MYNGKVPCLCATGSYPNLAEAQQVGKFPRIGILAPGSSAFPGSARYDSFRQGLRELGYIEGKNISIEIRYGEGKQD